MTEINDSGADQRLYRFVRARSAKPFVWGSTDCCMLAFDAVLELTGHDPAPDLRGAYSTAKQAIVLLRKMGGLRKMCADRIGQEAPVDSAQNGDIALLPRHSCGGETSEHGALGVVWRGVVAAQMDQGIGYANLSMAVRLWRPSP